VKIDYQERRLLDSLSQNAPIYSGLPVVSKLKELKTAAFASMLVIMTTVLLSSSDKKSFQIFFTGGISIWKE